MGNATDAAEKRVLIVDDSKFVRTTFNRILRSSFVVLEAVDGDAAWKTIQEDSSIVMVFSDLDRPKRDGCGLLRLIRGAKDERIRKLPVIVISGSLRIRSSLAPRMRRNRPQPSRFGLSRSENTMTIELSSWIVFQAASPSTASRTTKLDLRMRLNVVRTNFESSTMSTRFSAASVAFPIDSWRSPAHRQGRRLMVELSVGRPRERAS